jgi:hypothetical protein
MFRLLFAPLLAVLVLSGAASALAAEAPSRPASAAPVTGPGAAPATEPGGSRSELSLLLVLAFASIGGGVGLIAAGRGARAAESPSSA